MRLNTITHWLQHHSPLWTLSLGAMAGLGLGAGAFFGLGGLAGAGVGLGIVALTLWLGYDTEPVLVEAKPAPEPKVVVAEVRQSESELPLIEPLDMVEVKGGTFLMGSPDFDKEALDSEKPQHKVIVSDFWVNRFPITRQFYREIVGDSATQWQRDADSDRLPANYVSWFDAVTFCNALSRETSLQPCYRMTGTNVEWDTNADGYRLPTEAEWEYACRAVTTSKWFFGDDPAELGHYAWFAGNSRRVIQPVGEKTPNPWGVHDMIGNVWEWCWDWYAAYQLDTANNPTGPEDGSFRVLRGGSYRDVVVDLRSTSRYWYRPERRDDDVSVRVVRRPRRQP